MLPNTYELENCSIARAMELAGERWTLLIIRDAYRGIRRFDQFQADLGIARNVLRDRLNRLVEEGVLERRPYQERPLRHEYRLTQKGRDLWPIIHALARFGDAYYAPNGPPRRRGRPRRHRRRPRRRHGRSGHRRRASAGP